MPRPGPRRTLVPTRLAEDELADLDEVARTEIPLKSDGTLNRSEALRKLAAEAIEARRACLTRPPHG